MTRFLVVFSLPILITILAGEIDAQNAREGFFLNSRAILPPIRLNKHVGLSFRSCNGGQLFSQRSSSQSQHFYSMQLEVRADGLLFNVTIMNKSFITRISAPLLDNQWHNINILYRMGNLTISSLGHSQIIANSTYNSEILQQPELVGDLDVLVIGEGFDGCLLEGPNIVFNTSYIQSFNVVWGPCQMRTDPCTTFNPCSTDPCMQRGKCIKQNNAHFFCQCSTRYSGATCHIDNGPPCDKHPCQNGGTCNEDPLGEYSCYCLGGWAGKNCDVRVENGPCDRNLPCRNNGTCMRLGNGQDYMCNCAPGFEGKDCEINTNECVELPCKNGGVCVDEINGYLCLCDRTGYGGPNCELNINECENNPCLNNGICFDNYGGYTCQCAPGFGGQNCEQKLNDCSVNRCPNPNMMCVDGTNNIQCVCKPGFSGPNCETVLTETCMTRTCMNGGTCTEGVAGVSCNCTSDWTGPSCELPLTSCGPPNPCYNNGTCFTKNGGKGYYCECPDGYEGENCENNQNGCVPNKCPEGRTCVAGANSFECICPPGTSGPDCSLDSNGPCNPNPCQNQGVCSENQGNYTCECAKGWEGFDCSVDVDECQLSGFTPCQNNGLCVNRNGTYECYCKGGFSGVHCEFDVDECLSRPCLNGATCENKVNAFLCLCAPGYTGVNCEKDIDECMSNPCLNGATCRDEIATYVCDCPPGLMGRRCEVDIDDCASSPCQNNGRCKDGRNMYTCDCTRTGFEGTHCEININECASDPCVHGGVCEDGINDYECRCLPGYQGRNCELDIHECEPNPCHFNSSCFERSIESYYLTGNPNMPEHFNQTFNYSIASGYDCVCVKGSTGKDCEININECESNPCENKANCKDELDGYTCECEPGFEGMRCETNIDECARYTPCVHGTCVDGINQYTCECDGNWGGKNCSVKLTACEINECQNNGTCIPYLEGETVHKFNCSCVSGYQGQKCERVTTMSFNGSSYAAINTSRDEGYDLQFRFRTTLADALLTVGKGTTYYFLCLSDGRLKFVSSLLNKLEGVVVGSKLNNSEWQKVFVAINSSHVVLAANEEQTIYPINLNNAESSGASHTTFPVTYLGGVVASLRKYTSNYASQWMIGCMQDTMVNAQWILPPPDADTTPLVPSSTIPVSYVGVESGCKREEQCTPNPCHGHGACTDNWNFFKCDCIRPFLGSTCQYNYTAATFGYENITDSKVTVTVDPSARRAVRSILDISMFIRTREPSGGIFYLGSRPSSVNYSDETVIAAKLLNGELKVSFHFNGMLEMYGVDGVRLDNGFNHLIQVVRNVTTVQVKINSTEYFRKTISANGPLDLQILVLGSANNTSNDSPNNPPVRNFKGVIQDVQMNSGSKQMVLEFYPLVAPDIPEHERPMSIGSASFNTSLVLEGIVSDDACRSQPCAHGGTCVVTWNDFYCQCTVGHKGKQCEEMEFCQVQDCPEGSECRNLNTGYECVANITIHDPKEDSAGLHYKFVKGDASASLLDISVTYRSKTGGTILQIGPAKLSDNQESYFHVHIYNDQVNVIWKLDGRAGRQTMSKDPPDGAWTTVTLKMSDNTIMGRIFGGMEESTPQMFTAGNFSTAQWDTLVRGSIINIGGRRSDLGKLAYTTTEGVQSNDVELATDDQRFGDFFLGCIGEVRIGGLLLPYFSQEELNYSNSSNKDHFEMTDDSALGDALLKGCSLCFDSQCQNGGNCTDPENQYKCQCPIGYEGLLCETDIDECKDNHDCQHNSTCVDKVGGFYCTCLEGYQGEFCEFETNECLSNPCKNGGLCIDRLARFECNCTSDFVGPTCDQARQITCADNPCHNHGLCQDVKNPANADNFTCTCEEGFVGFWCESPYCEVQACAHGDCVNKTTRPNCTCHPGYAGKLCEIDVNECESNPCEHGGKCIDGVASFSCDCSSTGFKGPTCSVDIDECEIGEEICDNGGTCRNMQGGYVCDCPGGWCGVNCTYRDPCVQSVDNFVCFNDGKCKPACKDGSDYVCECTDSFTGKNCTEPVTFSSSRVADIALIVVPILTIILLAGVVSLFVFLMMARKKRATRGTYSPSSQEYCNPRVELDNVMKPPPEERLI